jgi:asparagine synthase (glutamine-hydrolysing)
MLAGVSGYERYADVNMEYIEQIVAFGHATLQHQPFNVVKELSPGSCCTLQCDRFTTSQSSYFTVPQTIAANAGRFIRQESDRTCIAKFDALINKSVQLHLTSDAPVGILCSGGVDSSLITAIAAKNGANIRIYHATVNNGPGELPYAEMVAKRYKLELHTIVMNPAAFLDALVDTTYHLDAPMYHPSDVSLHAISQKAHEHGIKALLCGEGADELFGGYGWHSLFSNSWNTFPLLKKVSRFIDNCYRAFRLFRHADYFDRQEYFRYAGAYLPYSNSNIPLFAKRNALLRSGNAPLLLQELCNAYTPADSFPQLAAFITSNLYGHLSTLLQRNDRMCMRASIESRVPFLENDLIDFALHLDSSYKVRGQTGKFIVKKCAEAYLPRPVIYRKKGGFPVPWQEYIRQVPLKLFSGGFTAHHFKLPHDEIIRWASADTELLYTAIALEIWGRIFVAGEPLDRIKDLLRN